MSYAADPRSRKVLNKFLEESDKEEIAGNLWTLVKTRDQKVFEKPTEPPVAEFDTDFKAASLDDLRDFYKSRSKKDGTSFAVLDERSVKDSTVLLVKWEFWTEHIDPNAETNLDDDSNMQQLEGWQTLRVPFSTAPRVMYNMEFLPVSEINGTGNGVDEHGVYRD